MSNSILGREKYIFVCKPKNGKMLKKQENLKP